MTGREPAQRRYVFGEFTLDVGRGVLWRGREELRLRPKSFDVLRYLVEHAGILVGRQALMDAVWGTTVVTEDSLTQCIIEVRRTLDDHHQRIVRTVPRRGFIFDADVSSPRPDVALTADAPGDSQDVPAGAPSKAASRKVFGSTAVLAVALVGTALGWWLLSDRGSPAVEQAPAPETPERSIAVLRFLDLSPAGDQAYFADGLAEEILHLLAQSPDLRVTARGSSFAFAAGSTDIAAISAQLGVRHVLEGSVRREGDSMRVTVQLIDAGTQAHVWSRTYDRVFNRLLELQSEIATDVAQALHVTLARPGHSTSPDAAAAQELYLLGRHLFHRRGPGDLAAAERHLEQAVALDPQRARAWTALAGAYNVRALDELRDPGYRLEDQRRALERALAIDPTLAEAHVRLARYYVVSGDRESAEAAFARARQLGPHDPLVLGTLASRESRAGGLDAAIELTQRLVALDPLSALYRGNLGHLLIAAGRYPSALAELRRTQALSPDLPDTDHDIAVALLLDGRTDEARRQLTRLPDGQRRDQFQVLLGPPATASAALARLQEDRSPLGHFLRAEIAAHQGDADRAFSQLGAALRAHEGTQARFEIDLPHEIVLSPFLRSLHDDPRWTSLQAELAPPWS